MISLDVFYDEMKAKARDVFNDAGYHVPLFVIEFAEGNVGVIQTEWHDDEEKHIAVRAVREACKEYHAMRVIIITEGWMVKIKNDPGVDPFSIKPSRSPDRSEVLFISGQSAVRSEKDRHGYYEINRDAKGKATVGNFVTIDDSHGTSLFDNLVGGTVLH